MTTAAPIPHDPSPDAAPIRHGALGKGKLPLLVEPLRREGRPVPALVSWLSARRAWIDERLVEHGAILLRGFAVDGAEDFERVVRAVEPGLKNDYLGTSPRNALTEYVFSASELPPYYPIPQHCEMSFIKEPPARLFFSCLVPSTGFPAQWDPKLGIHVT